MMNWGDCYLEHYGRFFGGAAGRRIFEPSAASWSIQILEYADVLPGCHVLASLGLSHYAREIGGVVEVFMPVDEGPEEASPLLANALSLALRDEMRLERGSLITAVETLNPAFSARFDKGAIYFTLPYDLPEDAAVVKCGGEDGRLLLALFLSHAESAFLSSQGVEALEDVLESRGVDPYKLSRRSVV